MWARLRQTSINNASIRISRAGSHMRVPRTQAPSVTMPPRAAVQTTLDAVFGVKLKRSAAEVAAASDSTPAKKRRKVSERCISPRRSLLQASDSCNAPIVRRLLPLLKPQQRSPSPRLGMRLSMASITLRRRRCTRAGIRPSKKNFRNRISRMCVPRNVNPVGADLHSSNHSWPRNISLRRFFLQVRLLTQLPALRFQWITLLSERHIFLVAFDPLGPSTSRRDRTGLWSRSSTVNPYLMGWCCGSKDPYHGLGQAHGTPIPTANTRPDRRR